MSKTKYKKVSVSDRLPEKTDDFHTDKGQLIFLPFAGWYRDCVKVAAPKYWLEEVPDYEEEMRDLLDEIYRESHYYLQISTDTRTEIEELLTKLKQS